VHGTEVSFSIPPYSVYFVVFLSLSRYLCVIVLSFVRPFLKSPLLYLLWGLLPAYRIRYHVKQTPQETCVRVSHGKSFPLLLVIFPVN
jgi:hypothetical protein